MTQQFKIDDIARVIRRGTAGPHMQGAEGRVVKVTDGWVYVEDRTGQGLFNYGGVKSYMFQPHDLELVSEGLADWEKELLGIETKQEEPEVKQIKAGDRVEAIETRSGVVKGQKYTVASLDVDTGLGQILETTTGERAFVTRFKLVTGKPKARSQEIELGDVQKGDLIVAFWNKDGVETRKKGIAHEKDWDGDWTTSEGEFLTYSDEADGRAEHIYLIERPEAKEPTKPEDDLDKTLTYVVKPKNSYSGTYYLKFVADAWRFRHDGVVVRESSSTVGGVEADLIEGKTSWEKPVPYEPTDLEKFEQAGNVGQKYKHCGMIYKLSKSGKVKVRSAGKGTPWHISVHTVGSFLELVEFGDAVKI